MTHNEAIDRIIRELDGGRLGAKIKNPNRNFMDACAYESEDPETGQIIHCAIGCLLDQNELNAIYNYAKDNDDLRSGLPCVSITDLLENDVIDLPIDEELAFEFQIAHDAWALGKPCAKVTNEPRITNQALRKYFESHKTIEKKNNESSICDSS